MKKLLIWLICVMMLVAATACGEEAPATNQPDSTTTTTTSGTPSDTDVNATEDATTTTTTDKDGNTSGTKKPTGTQTQASDNSVDFEQVFGTDPTTTTSTKKGETTTTTSSTTKKPTSTTKPTTTTTLKPTTIDKVSLPAVGTDVDGRGRIAVSKVELKNGVLTLKIRNNTDKQTQKWITEETNYVTYACYDKDGKKLKGKDEMYGYFYLGCLEAGDEIEFKVTLPAGTTKVELTGSKIVYWTPWS